MLATPALAQDRSTVSGTITLTPEPLDRIQLMQTRRPRLGVVVAVDSTPVDSIGALLLGVTPNGPAARAGLRAGDIVVRFNGKRVIDAPKAGPRESAPGIQLVKLAAELNPGDSALVQYRRGPALRQGMLVIGDAPNTMMYSLTVPPERMARTPMPRQPAVTRDYSFQFRDDSMVTRFDTTMTMVPLISQWNGPRPTAWIMGMPLANLELAPLNPGLGRYFGTDAGVLVINLPESSTLGLRPGDVVLSVDGREVRAPGMMLRVLMSYEPGEKVSLQIMRDKKKLTVTGMVAGQ